MKFTTIVTLVLTVLSFIFRICVSVFSFSKNGITVDYEITKFRCLTEKDDFKKAISVKVSDIQQCVFECGLRPSCKALDFLRHYELCKLYDVEDGQLHKGQCIHIRKSDIIVHDASINACNCDSGSVCLIGTNDCVYEECTRPDLKYGTVAGNLIEVGRKLQVKCNYATTQWTEFATTECLENGTWSFLPKCKSNKYVCSSKYDYSLQDLGEIRIEDKTEMVFDTMGSNDAHVLLQEARDEYHINVVEIVLGGWHNKKSVIRNIKGDGTVALDELWKDSGFLSPTSYKTFWITWKNGCVNVGYEAYLNHNTFMSWCGLTHAITAISVTYGHGSSGEFIFH